MIYIFSRLKLFQEIDELLFFLLKICFGGGLYHFHVFHIKFDSFSFNISQNLAKRSPVF
jgi:hypothetical protein